MRRWFSVSLALLVPLAAMMLLMISMQTQLLFPTDAVSAAGPLPANAEQLEIVTAEGDKIRGVHLKPLGAGSEPRTLIVGFGGNAWNAQDAAEYLHGLFPNAHVVAFHYRGYAPSTGSPSAKALLADAPRIFNYAVDRVRPERTVAIGFSIGSAVAASLAGKAGGLILVTPFDSLKAVAGDIYPWLPVGPFFAHEMDAAGLIGDNRTPVAIIEAERDEIIPSSRTEGLRRRVPNLVFDRTIASSGHNDIYQRPEFRVDMKEAFATVTRN